MAARRCANWAAGRGSGKQPRPPGQGGHSRGHRERAWACELCKPEAAATSAGASDNCRQLRSISLPSGRIRASTSSRRSSRRNAIACGHPREIADLFARTAADDGLFSRLRARRPIPRPIRVNGAVIVDKPDLHSARTLRHGCATVIPRQVMEAVDHFPHSSVVGGGEDEAGNALAKPDKATRKQAAKAAHG